MRRGLLALTLLALLAPIAALRADDDEPASPEEKPAPPQRVITIARTAAEKERLARRIRAATKKATRAIAGARIPHANRTLAALALERAGGTDEKFLARRLLDAWWADAASNRLGHTANYELALAISALEGLSLELVPETPPSLVTRYEKTALAPDVQRMLETATRALLEGRVYTFGGKGCAWSYGVAPFGAKRSPTRERSEGQCYDNSNTQFAVLALHDAARGGVAIPPEVAKGIAMHFLLCASSELPRADAVAPPADPRAQGSVTWGYIDAAADHPSMTFAALSSLAIARDLGFRDARVDAAIEGGLRGGSDLVSQHDPPLDEARSGWGEPYRLYSMEKALDLLESKIEACGTDWFAYHASRVVEEQGEDGLWEKNLQETCLYVLFLTRGTISKGRVVDGKTTSRKGEGTPPGEVFLPKTGETVDAVALVGSYAVASEPKTAQAAHARAGEAIAALTAEGHGREACLFPALVALAEKGGARREAAERWLRDLAGRDLPGEEAKLAAHWATSLVEAREAGRASKPRAALACRKLALPLRAYAASSLAQLPCPEAAGEIADAAGKLASESGGKCTQAGSRCARAYADALGALVRSPLPALAPKGTVASDDLDAIARAAKEALARSLAATVEKALEAHAVREKDAGRWEKARGELAALGPTGLRATLDAAADPKRTERAFALLRALTAQLIPDERSAWQAYLESGDE